MPVALLAFLLLLAGLIHVGTWGILFSNLAFIRSQKDTPVSSLPSLTVCIPARNEADNLRRLLPSLQDQKYPDLEILIWDDRSEDETWSVIDAVDEPRLTAFRGETPPEGWLGKGHALYQCTRRANGDCYVFLDADAELQGPEALRRLVARHIRAPGSVTSGLTHLRGGGLLLVSLLSHTLLRSLPWSQVQRTNVPELSALNGQCWSIDAEVYHQYEPHAETRTEILEDMAIGRYLKAQGHPPALLDLQDLVAVYMYDDFASAWRGFRKNTYPLMGGTPTRFVLLFGVYLLAWIVAPFLSGWFLASIYGMKLITDRASGMPLYVSVLAPISYLLGLFIQIDSAIHHWINRVQWKGRSVPKTVHPPTSHNTETSQHRDPPTQ